VTLFDMYPDYGRVQMDNEATSLYVRRGGVQVPHVTVLSDAVGSRYASRLNPYLRAAISGQQATAPGLVAVQSATGCPVPTGQEIPVAVSFLTSQQKDVYNQPVPGGPGMVSNALQTVQTASGDPVVSYAVADPASPPPAQFMANLYAGDAIALDPYGTYPWEDATGTKYPSLGRADPAVQKPRVRVLFDPNYFEINGAGELTLALDGESGVLAGDNIVVYPGPGPTNAPTITMQSSGVLDDGVHRWAYSWRSTLADGTHTTTALSPSASGTAGSTYNSAQIQGDARPDAKKYDALLIWRSTATDRATFFLVDTVTTSIDSAWTYNDDVTDGSLGDEFTASEPTISTMTTILLTGDPADADGTPLGTLTLGAAGKRSPLLGYSWAAGNAGTNSGAHLFYALDENHKADLVYVAARSSDGLTFTYPYNLIADWTITDAAGDKPVVSELMTGSLQALGGILGLVTDGHDPTDADVVGAAVTSGHVGIDGTTAVRHDFSHSRHFTRMGDAWVAQANLIFFSGTDSTGLTYNPALGDFGFGTDSSLWLCTAATTAPGTWEKVYPASGGVIGAFVWTTNTPSIWAEADTTPVKVVFDQGTDTTGGSIWTASADHFTIPSDGYYSFGYNVTVATNDFTGDGNPFRPRIGMRIDPMVTIDQPDVEDQVDYGTTTVTDYPQRFYRFNSSREAYFHAGDTVILFTSGGDGGGETGYLPNGALLFNHSAWIRKIG
jgi:hypothetical protein